LLAAEQHKLSQIAEIMQQKPDLNLRLNPLISEAFDREGLQLQLLLEKAPFAMLDLNQEAHKQWLEAQLTPEELHTHQRDDGTINHDSIWQSLLQRQQPDPQAFEQLVQSRLLTIKETLITEFGIPAERIYLELNELTDLPQSLVRLGVSQ
jgi:hypothetical protein